MAAIPEARETAITSGVRARAGPIIGWLMNDERVNPARSIFLLDRFARRLVEAGLPLARASLHIRQLHPQLSARSLVWDLEAGGAVETGHAHGVQNDRVYFASPVKSIFEGGDPIRRRLEDPDCPLDFPILTELKNLGLTDYSIRPMIFSGGRPNAISIGSKRPGGFSELDIATLDAALPTFAAVLELQQLRRTARELLNTYVGHATGERIFNGAIKRGDGEVIHAVLWYCDIRDFTALTQNLPLDQVIALLNDYFDRIAAPIEARGGEILKFMGDAMLAIFQCEATQDEICRACDTALAAAEAALDGVATLNMSREAAGKPRVHCGIAIHVGEVMYGNIGAAERLDFTVIGPAVNLVSRLEDLCGALGCPILVSAGLARASRRNFRSLGRHALKGIAEPVEALTPT
ncbi:MAG: adenylate/guanylate cyclase domain-containing protein [Kiloniellaceae bacterium]